jgi:hypothetical protein
MTSCKCEHKIIYVSKFYIIEAGEGRNRVSEKIISCENIICKLPVYCPFCGQIMGIKELELNPDLISYRIRELK